MAQYRVAIIRVSDNVAIGSSPTFDINQQGLNTVQTVWGTPDNFAAEMARWGRNQTRLVRETTIRVGKDAEADAAIDAEKAAIDVNWTPI